jgi:glycosyltransferase involved in cell wall biosynthesis
MAIQTLKYALVTPARNEAQFIEQTIQAVVGQTVLPAVWIIVSDGSTDGTDEIVTRYLKDHSWMRLVRMPERRDRHFGAKVHCFNAGLETVSLRDYEIVGNLDADITFDPEYLAFLLRKFAGDPRLGVAGTPFVEGNETYDYRYTNIEHVSGACQLFRRQCFEDIGGYVPIKGGGVDWVAVTTARMKGWKTRTFTEKVCHHHRPMGTANANKAAAFIKLGQQDYYLGGHPLWQLFRSLFQMGRKPYFVGGVLLMFGYLWASLKGVERPISPELMRFNRHEQLQRLRKKLGLVPGGKARSFSTSLGRQNRRLAVKTLDVDTGGSKT